jgi:hypothetical protein
MEWVFLLSHYAGERKGESSRAGAWKKEAGTLSPVISMQYAQRKQHSTMGQDECLPDVEAFHTMA